jgi:hypothetical protein
VRGRNDATHRELLQPVHRHVPATLVDHAHHQEMTMRNTILAAALLAGATVLPFAAHAQERIIVQEGTTTGMAHEPIVGIAEDLQPRFREYVVQENVPDYTVQERVVVGATLPETGVIYYDVPQRFGANRYRYTRVNGEYLVVEPRTRRVVQVID